MRRYSSLPIDQLLSDVPVDPVHVRELADSIKVSGPISPVLVREDTLQLIDGFHRVAAMRELGFGEVECILTPCDDETFWDLRIMSASLHKAVTFARAIDWVEEVFDLSPWTKRYKSPYSLFKQAIEGEAPAEVQEWAREKASKWGLSLNTVRQWFYGKQTLAPDLYEEARQPKEGQPPLTTYMHVARDLPGRPELQRQLVHKVRQEDLSARQAEEVAKALRHAGSSEDAATILKQPVSRTADDMARAARVEQLIREPAATPGRMQQQRELGGIALEVFLDLQQQVHSIRRVTADTLETLNAEQREQLRQVVDDLIVELQRVGEILGSPESVAVIEGRIIGGRGHARGTSN